MKSRDLGYTLFLDPQDNDFHVSKERMCLKCISIYTCIWLSFSSFFVHSEKGHVNTHKKWIIYLSYSHRIQILFTQLTSLYHSLCFFYEFLHVQKVVVLLFSNKRIFIMLLSLSLFIHLAVTAQLIENISKDKNKKKLFFL